MPAVDVVGVKLGARRWEASRRGIYPGLKRVMDVVLASLLLVGLSPVLLAVAVAVKLSSPGPILFRQSRVGQSGRRFEMLKFRSMRADSSHDEHREYIVAYIKGQAATQATADGPLYKLTRDTRVTPSGQFLRKTSLDELPQLWNVLWGEMSLVGPRPPIPYEVELYRPEHLGRLEARPGITGLWQVSGRNRTTFEEMVALDLEYIQRCSLGLDLWILVKTIPVVLLGSSAR